MPSSTAERAEVLRRLANRVAGDDGGAFLDELRRLGLVLRLTEATDPADDTALPICLPPQRGSLQVSVLGGFGIRIGGSRVDISSLRPRQRELLAALCMSAGSVVSSEQLLSWFWPDHDPGRAQHNLQVGISAIRRLLVAAGGGDLLARRGSGYVVNIDDPADCDARLLEHSLRLAALATRRGDRERTAVNLDAAVRVYRADLLPEFGYPEWVLAERDRLRHLVGDAHESLAQLRAAAGRHDQAVAAARAGLAHDQDRDVLWHILIESLEMLGEPIAAAAVRRRYDVMLADLGIGERTVSPRLLRSVG